MPEIKGNLVDIHRRKIYPVQITLKKGVVDNIDEIDEKLDTYIVPPFVDAGINLEELFLTPIEFGKVALRSGVVGGVVHIPTVLEMYSLEGLNWLVDISKKSPFKFFWSVNPYPNANYSKENILNVLNMEDVKSLGCVNTTELDEDLVYELIAAQSLDKGITGCVKGMGVKDINVLIQKNVRLLFGLEKDSVIRDIIKKDILVGVNGCSDLVDSNSSKCVFSSFGLSVTDVVHRYMDSWVRGCLQKDYDIFRVFSVSSLNTSKFFNLDIGMLKIGDRADFLVLDSIEDFNILQTYVNGNVVVDNGVYYDRDRRLCIPKRLRDDGVINVDNGEYNVDFRLDVMGLFSSKKYLDVVDEYEGIERARGLVVGD